MAESPRILLFDIEISPSLAFVWSHYEANVLSYEKQWELLAVSYKWLGDKKINCVSRRKKTEKEIVKLLHSLFDEADFLVAHNGDEFDWKKTNAKFIEYGLKPPSPSAKIDTKKLAKRYFKFNSNKLDDLCETLGLGRKVKTGGFDLWLGCMRGNKKYFLLMERYNKKDVEILERLYLKLRPWIREQPAISLAMDLDACPACGGNNLVRHGFKILVNGKKQRYQCNECGAWSQGRLTKK